VELYIELFDISIQKNGCKKKMEWDAEDISGFLLYRRIPDIV